MLNALALLGWSFDDKTTMFTVDELVEKFSVARISKSPAIFDLKKLEVLNGRYLRMMDADAFADALVAHLARRGFFADKDPAAEALVREIAPAVKRKLTTLDDFEALAGWLFRPLEIEPDAWDSLAADVRKSIQAIGGGLARLELLDDFTQDEIKDALQDQLHILGEDARGFLEPQRIALTGQRVSTGIYESLVLAGRDEALGRYRQTLARLADIWVA